MQTKSMEDDICCFYCGANDWYENHSYNGISYGCKKCGSNLSSSGKILHEKTMLDLRKIIKEEREAKVLAEKGIKDSIDFLEEMRDGNWAENSEIQSSTFDGIIETLYDVLNAGKDKNESVRKM